MSRNETVTINGVEYVQPDACSFGDYGGAGSVGLANIRFIIRLAGDKVGQVYGSLDQLEPEDVSGMNVIHQLGSYSSEQVWLRVGWEHTAEILADLESYPSLDDDEVSRVEMEWEDEAWKDWLKSDLLRAAFEDDEDTWEQVEALPDETLFEAFRHAMECSNTYPEPEYSGVHVDVERVAPEFRTTVLAILEGKTVDQLARERWPSIYSR